MIATAALARTGVLSRPLLRLELKRVRRNRRTLLFSAVVPVIFFLLFSSPGKSQHYGQFNAVSYYMVGMATYAAMNALFSGGALIAAERAVGWPRQLRVAGIPSSQYVATKVIVAYLTALPGVIAVLFVGVAFKDVHLSGGKWIGIIVSTLLGLLPVAALGVAIGYLVRAQTLQPLLGLGSAFLALIGCLWIPASVFGSTVVDVFKVFPTYWSAYAGRSVLLGSWVGWQGAATLAVWTVALGLLAGWAFRRDSLRPAAAGTT